MKAVGLYRYLPIDEEEALVDLELPRPQAEGHDLLVSVKAVSVNPVDTKVRAPKAQVETQPRVLGWDAAGEVVATGEKVTGFQVGDAVFYAGDLTRQGSNTEFQLVDERLVARKPESLEFSQAAALPLTSLTAWEGLFERLGILAKGGDAGRSLLIIGGAGGVGSIAIQLAAHLAKMKVIATASRPETREWCQQCGALHVVNHRQDLVSQVQELGFEYVDYIFCLNDTDQHWDAMAELIAPQGGICCIVDNREPIALNKLKNKSVRVAWEFMFTRSMYRTSDMVEQQVILQQVAQLVDEGALSSTVNQVLRPINAANLRKVHRQLEQGSAVGKYVLSDWE